MTIFEVRKLFKKRYGVLPIKQSEYHEIQKKYKIEQAASNKTLALMNAENKIRTAFKFYCEAYGIDIN